MIADKATAWKIVSKSLLFALIVLVANRGAGVIEDFVRGSQPASFVGFIRELGNQVSDPVFLIIDFGIYFIFLLTAFYISSRKRVSKGESNPG